MKKFRILLIGLLSCTLLSFIACNNDPSANDGGASGTYYSYEATNSNGSVFKYNAEGEVTEGDEAFAPRFVKFTLGAGNKWTYCDPGLGNMYDADLADYCTYTLADGTLTISMGDTTLLTATAADGGEYTATIGTVSYKLKK